MTMKGEARIQNQAEVFLFMFNNNLSLVKVEGWFGFILFCEKITCTACLVLSGLNTHNGECIFGK